jgi:glycyl-tRNA synthetase alpha chain
MSLSFQQIILKLQTFWAENGCAVLQPIDIEVGAGTLHWATVLHALGNKQWRVAYVQPCRRPTDARYAKNPNRLSHYFQFQVLLKPAPANIQQLYLRSLDYIGLNTENNDIRFVEDDWENPSVGASGLGWEVWFNGMEVSQFTYMKQVGGIECELISGEITYGLERIAMHIQQVDSIFDIKYNDCQNNTLTYGDIFKQNEIENSFSIMQYGNRDQLFANFEQFKTSSQLLASNKLPIPAYEQALKASNVLNLLDAGGFISVAERASFILQVRQLVKSCCQLMLEQQQS